MLRNKGKKRSKFAFEKGYKTLNIQEKASILSRNLSVLALFTFLGTFKLQQSFIIFNTKVLPISATTSTIT